MRQSQFEEANDSQEKVEKRSDASVPVKSKPPEYMHSDPKAPSIRPDRVLVKVLSPLSIGSGGKGV